MSGPTLLVFADAGPEIGLGHLARVSGVIARARERGWVPTLVSDAHPSWVASIVGEVAVVPSSSWRQHVNGATWMIIDGARSLQRVGGVAAEIPTLVFDDLAVAAPPASVIVNANLGAERWRARYPAAARCLLGRRYHCLRTAVTDLPRGGAPLAERAQQIWIVFGGSDPAGATARVVAALPNLSADVHVVVGPAFGDRAGLDKAVARSRTRTITVSCAPPSLLPDLAQADLVIAAAGGMLAELAYLGRSVVAWAICDDQVANARAHAEAGLIGGGNSLAAIADQEIAAEIECAVSDWRLRHQRAAALADSVDGAGAARVVEILTPEFA